MPYKNIEEKTKYDRERYTLKKDLYKKKASDFYYQNKEKVKERIKIYYKDNKETVLKRVKEYRLNNLDKVRKTKLNYYQRVTKERLKNEPALKIKFRLRKRIWEALRRENSCKYKPTLELLGCENIEFLKEYLQNKFSDGMSWDNYGKWHIDHIKPLSSFDLSNEEQQKIAFHYTNLQPLWAIDNLRKGDRTEPSETTR